MQVNIQKIKRSTDSFVRTPFHMLCPARYSVLLFYVLSSDKNSLSLLEKGDLFSLRLQSQHH